MSKILIPGLLMALCCTFAGCQKQPAEASTAKTSTPSKPEEKFPKPVVATKAYDGPFGLGTKMSLVELSELGFKQTDYSPTIFVGDAPKPMDGVNEYAVVATPQAGACRIIARVNVPLVNDTGDQVKEKVDQLAELMSTKYGRHSSKTDFVTQDVYRRNPQFWMMALKEDSAAYGYSWKTGKTEPALPADIDRIEIQALAVDTRTAWVSIKYTFKNFDACAAESKKSKAANL